MELSPDRVERLQRSHADAFLRREQRPRARQGPHVRDQVRHAKPDPDLFLAAASRLGVAIESATVVGDAVWDMLAAQRARALGIGLLSGGYGEEELARAGAYRVFADPAGLLEHLDEVGGRR